jgi:hypothetical protein
MVTSLERRSRLCPIWLALAIAFHASTTLAAPAEPKTPSAWLGAAAKHDRQGRHREAGTAYERALDAMSPEKQKADEGAQAAMLAAEAYWRAFDANADIADLKAAFDVLERWSTLTGPTSSATMLPDVRRMLDQVRAILDPLQAAHRALASKDYQAAATLDQKALDAVAVQKRDWIVGARITLDAADSYAAAFEATTSTDAPALGAGQLEAARAVLENWLGQRPPSDTSAVGEALERRLVEVRARIEAVEAAQGEQARLAALGPAKPAPPPPTPSPVDRPRARRPVVPIVLSSTGAVATAVGAALLGEGLASRQEARDHERRLRTELADDRLDPEHRNAFQADIDAYVEDARRYSLRFLASGAALAAGGLAATTVGIVGLVRHRRIRAPRSAVALRPTATRTSLELSLSGRF